MLHAFRSPRVVLATALGATALVSAVALQARADSPVAQELLEVGLTALTAAPTAPLVLDQPRANVPLPIRRVTFTADGAQPVLTPAAASAEPSPTVSTSEMVVKASAAAATPVAALTQATRPGAFDPTLIELAQKLTIKFQGYAQISGDYRVNADKTISIPVVGRVDVAGVTAATLERTLAERVVRITGREAHVTIEVDTYQPVFVTGYVAEAGAYPWEPGMLVINAETLSGGVFRPQSQAQVQIQGRDERARVLRFASDLARLLAARSRLTAEKTGADDLRDAPRLIELVGVDEARRLTDAQRAVFRSNRIALDAELAAVKRARDTAKRELEGLQNSKERIESQLAPRIKLLAGLQGLLKRGLSTQERVLDVQANIARIEERSASIGVALTRVRGVLAGLERQDVELKEQRNAVIETSMVDLEGKIAAMEIDLESARTSYRERTGRDLIAEQAGRTQQITYEIVRRQNGLPSTFEADRFMELRPGDILVVKAIYDRPDVVKARRSPSQ